ncbi:MAG: AMP-dependent synthetase [Thermoplasmata archaeon]|nr:MAG: AMP-dependent synthetase [Thermoplasmata archaeon]RLF53228.1 MAG: AMP-dependent synthetase [Thermoplasmata archaeon]
MKNEIVWKPSKEYIENANITRFMKKHNIKNYDELIKKSTENIEWFWDAIMKDLDVEWYQPYTKVYDDSEGIQWTKWFINGKINIVHNTLDRHAESDKKNNIAIIWENEKGDNRKLTYYELYREVNKFANALKQLGVKRGDRIGIYMPMIPEIVIGFLAVLKTGAIAIPIFSGFGGHALASRLDIAEAKVLLTADGTIRRGKTVEIKKEADKAAEVVKSLKHVIVYKRLGIDIPWEKNRDIWWTELVNNQSDEYETEQMDSEDYAMIIFSSGTTGKPKGTVHTHGGALAQIAKELRYYFDVKENDVFFWLTDIGWMMGPWMIIGVHTFAGAIVIYEGAPNYPQPDKLWKLIEKHRITQLGISPTAIRLLMRYGEEWVEKHDLSSLKLLGSTGEPWDPDSWNWFFEKVGRRKIPIINISGGTEIVGCFLSPLPITELKPCTLRGPGLGMDIDVFDDEGKPVRGQMGHLVAKKPAPSMTRGFWNEPERYLETYWSRWPGIWYHGDWASIDEDGFWFLHGRSDDTIKVAGRRTGPAEIEAALIEHPAVSEAATIGVPDEIKGEDIVSFVVLKPGYKPDEKLREELKNQVVKVMGKTLKPRDVKFVRDLPKTRSAKIVRRVIKATFLGEEISDLSSIENPRAIKEIENAV